MILVMFAVSSEMAPLHHHMPVCINAPILLGEHYWSNHDQMSAFVRLMDRSKNILAIFSNQSV